MNDFVFNVHQEEDGGYWAEAETKAIITQGDTWQELRANVQEALDAYYGATGEQRPSRVRLHLVHDEELLVA